MTRMNLRAGLRAMPLTEPLLDGRVESDLLSIEACGATPYTNTFRQMARDLAYDIAEMPVATQLLLADAEAPVAAMPVVLAGGGLPHGSLLCHVDSGLAGPQALRGKRIGIRAYAQTTGVWIRGVLQHEYGVMPEELRWVTTEASHVAGFVDPANVSRSTRTDLVAMLRSGEVDAIIASPHVVREAHDVRPVIEHASTVARQWADREGVHGVNHVLALKRELVTGQPWIVEELARLFVAARELAVEQAEAGKRFVEFGDRPNRKSVDLMLRYAHEQGMTQRRFAYDDLFLAWPDTASRPGH